MKKPEIPNNEDLRLNTLNSLGLLDTAPDRRFDRFTKLAKKVFDVPIALVSLIDFDRQWFKSCLGLPVRETPREISFCGHAILQSMPFVIPNTLVDSRFSDNPLVTDDPNIRFYAGYPLSAPSGDNIGTLCVISDKEREFTEDDKQLLIYLGELVEQEIRFLNDEITDPLTGIFNEQGFLNLANRALIQYAEIEIPLSVLYIDIDHFRELNNRHAYSVGDRVLVEFSELLIQAFRGADSVARLNNDNFAVLVVAGMMEKIHQPMQKLIESIMIRNQSLQRSYELSFSMGLANFDRAQHKTIKDVLIAAEQKMLDNRKSKENNNKAGR